MTVHRERLRILMVSNVYPPEVHGGYELLARDVAEELRVRGHCVTVLTSRAPHEDDNCVRTLSLWRPFANQSPGARWRQILTGWKNARATRAALRKCKPDVALLMSQRRLGLAPWRELQKAAVPVVVTVNDDWPAVYSRPPGHSRLRGLARSLLDAIFSWRTLRGLSPASALYLSAAVRTSLRAMSCPLPDGKVLPQGVDLRVFQPRAFRPIPAEPQLAFVGRLHPSKAPEVAIDTVAALAARGIQARLVLYGEPVSATYGEELRQRSSAAGVAARVRFAGGVRREDLPARLKETDALLFASRLEHEGQGLTYLEAMACGVPVLAAPSGGAREFLSLHPSALLVGACEGEAFATALAGLMGREAEQRAMVERSLDVVRRCASLHKYVDALEHELAGAVARTRSPRLRNGDFAVAGERRIEAKRLG